ncbi:MAG: hypothetical protein KDC98_02795 [Planctomycetes bacterium]|nr:hypothetical protein [Planctomycetota bacterium]
MRKLQTALGILLGGCLMSSAPQDPATPATDPTVIVGTFDSRAVLMAYVRSPAFSDYVAAQKKDIGAAIARAREVGDHELIAELEALGPEMQNRIHRQGFGTAPIDDVLARIEDRLPKIAETAGVDVIVSKWQLAYQSPTARFVDVTDQLAAEFAPDEATRKVIEQIKTKDPVPLEELKKHQ